MSTERSPPHAIRRLSAQDLTQLRSHMTRLGPDGLRARFGYQVSDAFLDVYAERCIASNAVVYGYFEHGTMHGLGEMHLAAHDPARGGPDGELAFSVESRWRRRGIGTGLIRNLLLVARDAHVGRLMVQCAADNEAMLCLIHAYATDLTLEDGVVTGHVAIGGVGVDSSDAWARPVLGTPAITDDRARPHVHAQGLATTIVEDRGEMLRA